MLTFNRFRSRLMNSNNWPLVKKLKFIGFSFTYVENTVKYQSFIFASEFNKIF